MNEVSAVIPAKAGIQNNNLPEGWERLAIEDIAEVNPRVDKSKISDDLLVSFVPMPAVEAESGAIDVSQERPFSEVKKGFTPFVEGDVLFAKITPCMENGKMAVAPKLKNGYGFGSTEFHVLRPKEGIESKYIYYYVSSRTFRGVAQHNMSGAVGQKRVPTNYLKQHLIPVAPPEQQKRIVAKIEELFSHIDAGIEALKKAKQLLKQYRQSVLKAAVTGELTKEWREARIKDDAQGSANVAGGRTPGATKLEPASQLLERILKERRQRWEEQQLEQFKAKGKMPKDDKWKEKYKEPVGYSYEGYLPELPDSWTWVSPDQIASTDDYALAIGPFGSNLKVSDYREEGVPLVFVRNIRTHNYDKGNTKYVNSRKAIELKAHSISGGDVLITKMGEPPGDASIYPGSAPDAIITADCIKWRFSQLIECPELYVHIINSQLIKSQVLKRTKGVAQKKISLGTFKSVAFPFPPLGEQREILQQIEQKLFTSDCLFKELSVQHVKVERNKQSILIEAFKGCFV